MTATELAIGLKNRIAEKRKANTEIVLSLAQLEQWLDEILNPRPAPYEPGYPRFIVRTLPKTTPEWCASGPQVQRILVNSKAEERAAMGLAENAPASTTWVSSPKKKKKTEEI